MKILNLYCGLGGNRKLWDYPNIEVTGIELNESIAKYYSDYYPKDKVIITDAHKYLLNHYNEYDFIWSSFPCQSHSRARFWAGHSTVYPDLGLYQEILLLRYYFKGYYVVENVNPFYKPLIKPHIQIGRHLFWSNFEIDNKHFPEYNNNHKVKEIENLFGIDTTGYKFNTRRDQVLRNCVNPDLGKHILDNFYNKYWFKFI